MTDDEARTILHEMRHQPSARMAEAVRHALQAIEDRAAVLLLYDEDGGGTPGHHEARLRLHFAIERHMRGEE